MTVELLQSKIKTIKGGTFFRINYQSEKNGLTKKTRMVARFVAYSHIKGVVAKGNVNPNEQWLSSNIVYNANTKKTYLQLATTKVKSKSQYFNGNNEIAKAEYELINKPYNGNNKPTVIRIDINNIISIG